MRSYRINRSARQAEVSGRHAYGHRELSSARRAPVALLTNATSSVGNLALGISIAHGGSLSDLGKFGVALSVYILATGMVRTAVTDTVLSHEYARELHQNSVRRTVLLGLVAAPLTIGVGVVLGQAYLVLLGCALPGIFVYDYVKITSLGAGSPTRALAQELLWTASTIAIVALGLSHHLGTHEVFAGWAFACAALGVGHALLLKYNLAPAWGVDRDETRVGITFSLDFLAGSGIAQVTTMAVAATAGVTIAGALRGAGTVLAPLTILSGTLPSLLIPHLAKARRIGVAEAARVARKLAITAFAVAFPLCVLLLLIPDHLGELLLSGNWHPARSVLPMVAAESVFGVVAAIPFAGHRIERAGGRALSIRIIRAPFQIGLVVASGVWFGAQGAATAMATMGGIGTLSWWLSYRQLLRKAAVEPDKPCEMGSAHSVYDGYGSIYPDRAMHRFDSEDGNDASIGYSTGE